MNNQDGTIPEIYFKRPKFFGGLFLQLGIGMLAGLLASILVIQIERGVDIPLHLLIGALFFCVAIALVVRFLSLRKKIKPIAFERDALLLPYGSESFSCKKVPYTNIYSFDVRGRQGRQTLVVDTKSRAFTYPLKDFQDERAAEIFGGYLRDRIASMPDGEGELHWQRMSARRELAATLSARRYPVTLLLLGIIAVIYAVQMLVGAQQNQLKLLELGANAPGLVKGGQWYRLITSNFLHANLTHIAVNGIALWLLGALLERLIGGLRLLLIFMVSGLLGALCSAWFITLLFSVGASASIFGLLGALAFINWRFRNELPGGYRIPLHTWLIILGINAALPVFIPQIDIFAHLGGFAAGALIAFTLYGKQVSFAGLPLYGGQAKALTVALGAVFLLGGVQAVAHYPDTAKNNNDRIIVTRALLQSPDQEAGLLNSVAWSLAIEPDSTVDALRVARELADRAVESAAGKHDPKDVTAYLDTLATAHYRLGNFNEAVDIQRDVLNREDNAWYAGQLARFLKARVEKNGPVVLGEVALSGIKLHKPAAGAESIVLDLAHPAVRGMEIYAYTLDAGGRLLGLLRLAIVPDTTRTNYVIRTTPEVSELLAASGRLEPALIDARDCHCSHKENEGKFWPYDPSIVGLP